MRYFFLPISISVGLITKLTNYFLQLKSKSTFHALDGSKRDRILNTLSIELRCKFRLVQFLHGPTQVFAVCYKSTSYTLDGSRWDCSLLNTLKMHRASAAKSVQFDFMDNPKLQKLPVINSMVKGFMWIYTTWKIDSVSNWTKLACMYYVLNVQSV